MIELSDVSHTYRTEHGGTVTVTRALEDFSLSVPERQFLAVVGPSGCGKSTLLRLIAGLIKPTKGEVRVHGRAVEGPGPDRAVVFQQHSLYPWRTVEANVRLGLELSGIGSNGDAGDVVARHLELVGLTEFADHYPHQLSGGMQQRVGVARALAVSPSILLMDEPFGSVDAITRAGLGAELLRIWDRHQRTVVFVTHSLNEALALSDRVLLMKAGGVVHDTVVDIPRPRDAPTIVEDPRFLELRHSLRELL